MRSVLVKAATDADGKLHLVVPAEPGEYVVELRISRVLPEGWPPGHLESVIGSITDPAFEAPPRDRPCPVRPRG